MAYQSIYGPRSRFGSARPDQLGVSETPEQVSARRQAAVRNMERANMKGRDARVLAAKQRPSHPMSAQSIKRRQEIREARSNTPRSKLLAKSRQKSAQRITARETRRKDIAKLRWEAANPQEKKEKKKGRRRRGRGWGRGGNIFVGRPGGGGGRKRKKNKKNVPPNDEANVDPNVASY